jgi:hypothetical protein
MCLQRKLDEAEAEGYDRLCPVLSTQPDAQMVGIARLHYRPHTSRTAAWYAELQKRARALIERYRELAMRVETSRARLGSFG